MKVFCLVTVRTNPPAPGSVMVFDTIRTGFPTAELNFQINRSSSVAPEVDLVIIEKAKKVSAENWFCGGETIHHEWIHILLERENEPFWLCDTDVMFWDKVEHWKPKEGEALMGRRIPQFLDEFTGTITRPRLHPSLLYVDPVLVRTKAADWRKQFLDSPFNPLADLVNPLMVPFKGKAHFYDTMGMLYHAIGGQAFTDEQLDCFDHMNFGTLEDLVLPKLQGGHVMKGIRNSIYANPIKGKGMWRIQERYYENRQV